MSYYVKRTEMDTSPARVGWTGPIRSEQQAHKEAAAWESCGWAAVVLASSPEVKAAVREWGLKKKVAS